MRELWLLNQIVVSVSFMHVFLNATFQISFLYYTFQKFGALKIKKWRDIYIVTKKSI